MPDGRRGLPIPGPDPSPRPTLGYLFALLTAMVSAPLVMPDVLLGLSSLLLFVSMEHFLGWPAGRGANTITIAFFVADLGQYRIGWSHHRQAGCQGDQQHRQSRHMDGVKITQCALPDHRAAHQEAAEPRSNQRDIAQQLAITARQLA